MIDVVLGENWKLWALGTFSLITGIVAFVFDGKNRENRAILIVSIALCVFLWMFVAFLPTYANEFGACLSPFEFYLGIIGFTVLSIAIIAEQMFVSTVEGKERKAVPSGISEAVPPKPLKPKVITPSVSLELEQCSICLGLIKKGLPVIKCVVCSRTFHESCAKRVVKCPFCKITLYIHTYRE